MNSESDLLSNDFKLRDKLQCTAPETGKCSQRLKAGIGLGFFLEQSCSTTVRFQMHSKSHSRVQRTYLHHVPINMPIEALQRAADHE